MTKMDWEKDVKGLLKAEIARKQLSYEELCEKLKAIGVEEKPNQIFISFNPIDEFHWIKDYLIDNKDFSQDIKIIHSTYRDNPFLDERSRKRYEDLINQDINFYRI